jgi:hypothetical protein
MRFRISPASALAAAALFVALGGSAFAVADAVKPQPRCATGAVRGIAAVTGLPSAGMGNVPDRFSSTGTVLAQVLVHGRAAPGAARRARRLRGSLPR